MTTEETTTTENQVSPEQAVVHTPGPWRQGGSVTFLREPTCREIVADDGRIGLVYGIIDAENKANARLIAAAPDMLEVLREVALPPYHDSNIESLFETLRARANAVLAKVV